MQRGSALVWRYCIFLFEIVFGIVSGGGGVLRCADGSPCLGWQRNEQGRQHESTVALLAVVCGLDKLHFLVCWTSCIHRNLLIHSLARRTRSRIRSFKPTKSSVWRQCILHQPLHKVDKGAGRRTMLVASQHRHSDMVNSASSLLLVEANPEFLVPAPTARMMDPLRWFHMKEPVRSKN